MAMGKPSSWILYIALALASCQREVAVPWQPTALSPAALETLAHPPFLVDGATAARYRQEGLTFRQEGDFERAIATLKIAAALAPRNPEGQVLLGWTQHLAGHAAPAAAALQTALTHSPDHVPALNALGIVYLVDGRELTTRSLHDKEWVTMDKDLLPLMREGMKAAWKSFQVEREGA